MPEVGIRATVEPLRPLVSPHILGEAHTFHQSHSHTSVEESVPWQFAFPCAPHSRVTVAVIVLLHKQSTYRLQYL